MAQNNNALRGSHGFPRPVARGIRSPRVLLDGGGGGPKHQVVTDLGRGACSSRASRCLVRRFFFLSACLPLLSLRLGCKVRPHSCHIHQLSSALRHCSRKLDAFLSILPVCFCALHGAEKRPAHNQSSDFPTASIAGTRWAHGC